MANQVNRTEIRPDVFRSLVYTDSLMLAIIDFENGPWTEPEPYHSHPHEQVTYVAEGEIIFFCEGEPERRLRSGDVFAAPSNAKHTVQILSKRARLVDSFTPIREEFLG